MCGTQTTLSEKKKQSWSLVHWVFWKCGRICRLEITQQHGRHCVLVLLFILYCERRSSLPPISAKLSFFHRLCDVRFSDIWFVQKRKLRYVYVDDMYYEDELLAWRQEPIGSQPTNHTCNPSHTPTCTYNDMFIGDDKCLTQGDSVQSDWKFDHAISPGECYFRGSGECKTDLTWPDFCPVFPLSFCKIQMGCRLVGSPRLSSGHSEERHFLVSLPTLIQSEWKSWTCRE